MSAEAVNFSISSAVDGSFFQSVKQIRQQMELLKNNIRGSFKTIASATTSFNPQNFNLSSIADAGSASMSSFQNVVSSVSGVLDSFQNITGGSNETVNELSGNVQQAGQFIVDMKLKFEAVKSFGQTLEEAGVGFESLKSRALKAYSAIKDKGVASSIKSLAGSLSGQLGGGGVKVFEALKSGAAGSFQEMAGKASSVVDALQGITGESQFLQSLGSGIDYVGSLASKMGGAFDQASSAMDTLKEMGINFDSLKSQASSAYSIIKDKGAFGALKAGVGSAAGMLKTVLFSAFGAVKTVIASTASFLFTNPIGLAIMAICGLVAVIFSYWEPIKEFFVGLFEPLMPVFQMVWGWIKTLAVEACAIFMSAWSPVKEFFVMLWEGLKSGVMFVWDILKKVFSWSPFALIKKGFGKVFDWISSKFEWVSALARKVKGWFSWIPGLGDDDEEVEENLEVNKTIKAAQESTPAAQTSKLASTPAQVNTSNSINIKAAPGQSEEAIAEAVVRKMDEREAEKQRSALYDTVSY